MPPKTKKHNSRKAASAAAAAPVKAKKESRTSSERELVVDKKPLTLPEKEIKHKMSDDDSQEGSLDVGACCLCHSSMDFTDRAAFFRADRMEDYNEDTDNEDDYVFRPSDPYLPVELYDINNALLYCDGCNRLYHQKCHFCPVTVIPRGEWHCLLCCYFSKGTSPGKTKKASRRKEKLVPPVSPKKTTTTGTKLYQQMFEAYTTQQLFVSPPVTAAKHLEEAWEFHSRSMKATYFQSHVIKRLRQYVESQASSYRLAETAVVTLTSTSKNRSHFFKQSSSSQELAQTLVKLYGIRKNWRQACWMLHDLQRATNTRWDLLQHFCDTAATEDFIARVLFPFGRQHGRRIEPRTGEAKLAWGEEAKDSPPKEITLKAEKGKKKAPPAAAAAASKRSSKKAAPKQDDDSGISLNDLQCCVCFASEATDENDLVLCDGQGCFRAYHAHCISPALKQADLEENVDWFCPYCSALADTFLTIQTIHMGDEWEQERYAAMLDKKGNADLGSSLQSWSHVEQVFPTAEQDYAAACQMKEGKRNKATDDLLARVLGLDELPDHDDDDEVEDGNFDLDSYQKQREEFRKQKKEESEEESEASDDDDDDESSHSSRATLVEMSSVELEVGRAELDALSKASSDEEDDDDANGGARRRSRRLRRSVDEAEGKELLDDIGEFDEGNIVEGKRGRKPVDYIQLNQAIFGDVPDEEAVVLDDAEEFKQTTKKMKDGASDGGDESSSREVGSDNEDADSGGDEEEDSDEPESACSEDKAKEEKRKTKLKANPPESKNKRQKRKADTNGLEGGQKKKPRRNGHKTSKKEKSSSGKGSPRDKKPAAKNSRESKAGQKNGSTATLINGDKKEPSSKRNNAATAKPSGHAKAATSKASNQQDLKTINGKD